MSVNVTIASDANDFQACLAVRAAAFLARGEPYHEEYDGNDLVSATHLLARQGTEPVGTMRIRILSAANGGTVVWERLAILPVAHRGIAVLNALAETARQYTMFKECRTVIGCVADQRLMKFWKKHGFHETGEPPVVYNGVNYEQIRLRLTPVPIVTGLHESSQAEAHRFVGTMDESAGISTL